MTVILFGQASSIFHRQESRKMRTSLCYFTLVWYMCMNIG